MAEPSNPDAAARKREQRRKRYAANKDKINARRRQRYSASGEAGRDKRREYNRQYRAANLDRIREQKREHYDPEAKREYNRRYREANLDRIREQKHERYMANREEVLAKAREYHAENRETYSARGKIKRANGYKSPAQRRRDEIKARLWCSQDGRCYLCEEVLSLEDACLDHDHRCCPEQQFCSFCIRGLSHPNCNYLIGHAGDDPDRLERIALNLRTMLAEIDSRLASKPVQAQLELE